MAMRKGNKEVKNNKKIPQKQTRLRGNFGVKKKQSQNQSHEENRFVFLRGAKPGNNYRKKQRNASIY